MPSPLRPAMAALMALLLAGCATHPPPLSLPAAPAQWRATLPHGGDATALVRWWQGFDDGALPALIERAQASHPALTQAVARIDEARAAQGAAGAALLPSLEASARASRAATLNPTRSFSTQGSAGVDAQWEIDLFGAARAGQAAQAARAGAAVAAWHDARVSLAAEVAQVFIGLRACEALLAVFEQEARSQARTAELTAAKVGVGFEAPAAAALAEAGAAESSNRAIAQRAECDFAIKALVMLSGEDETAVRQLLSARQGQLPAAPALGVQAVPAQALAQRPDLAGAERELAAAAAELTATQAQRWPQLQLGGSVALSTLRVGGQSFDGLTFGFGPVLRWSLFDGGRRGFAEDAAGARLQAARAAYALRLRAAVREVEEALLRLDAARRREADALRAATGFRRYFEAAEQRWRVGSGSLIEMEDARRIALAAQAGLIAVQREAGAAAVALYKSLGGGWQPDAPGPSRER